MTSTEKREKLDGEKIIQRQRRYQVIDDDTIAHLKEYYKLDDRGELLKFVKEHCMKGDDDVAIGTSQG